MPCLTRLLLAAALTFACLPAKAQEGNPSFLCGPLEGFRRTLLDLQARGVWAIGLEREAAKGFLDSFNAAEPATDYTAETVVFVIGPEVGMIALVTGDRSCVLRVPMPADALRAMIKDAQKSAGQPI